MDRNGKKRPLICEETATDQISGLQLQLQVFPPLRTDVSFSKDARASEQWSLADSPQRVM